MTDMKARSSNGEGGALDASLFVGTAAAQHATAREARGRHTVTRVHRSVHVIHAAVLLLVPPVAAALLYRPGSPFVAFATFIAMYSLTALGVTLGYHRLLAHRAFRARPGLTALLVVLGQMAGQGPVMYWVANHRRHHQYSDRDGDPHSPHRDGSRALTRWRGFWHAHVGWTFDHELTNASHYCKDLLRDPLIRSLNRHYLACVALGIALPTAIGALLGGSLSSAITGLVWGGLVRLMALYHVTLAINSVAHLWGGRAFATHDESRNNAWLAIPSFGEGWHNNHHAFPHSGVFALTRGQIDLGGMVARVLQRCHLIADLRVPTPSQIAQRRSHLLQDVTR